MARQPAPATFGGISKGPSSRFPRLANRGVGVSTAHYGLLRFARDHRTGLKSTISGQFLLVAGWRWLPVDDPRTGFGHTLCWANAVKYFDWDDAKNAKLRAERGVAFEDVVVHIERGDLPDILKIRLSSKDVEAIQKRALAEGLPYQTLIPSLLHRYSVSADQRSLTTHRGAV